MAVRALVVFVLLAAGSAAADGFTWDAPAGCPAAPDVRELVARRLVEHVEVHEATRVLHEGGIRITVTRARGEYTATVDTRALTSARQVRTLTSARCHELAEAVAVIVARLAREAVEATTLEDPVPVPVPGPGIDPTLLAVVPARPALRVAVAPERVRPATTLEVVPEVLRRPGRTIGVRALALSGIGMGPRVGVGGELAAFVQRREAFAEVGYARWVGQSMYLIDGAPGRLDVDLHLVAARGGWASQRMPLRAWLGAEVGQLTGTGVALYQPQSGHTRWIAIASGFGVGWPMTRHVRLVGTFELAVPLERARFVLRSDAELFQPAPASARCAVGFELGWN